MTLSESRMQYPVPAAIEHPDLVTYRSEFPILQRKTYMNSCSLGALSNRSMQNMEQFMEMWNEWGAHAWYEIWMGEIAKARQKFATIIGADPGEVAIAPNVSTALSSIASALDYSERNNVVMADMDFPRHWSLLPVCSSQAAIFRIYAKLLIWRISAVPISWLMTTRVQDKYL